MRGNNFRHCNGETTKGVRHGRSQQPTVIILSDRRSGTDGQTSNRACKGVTPKGSATEEVRCRQPTAFLTGEGVESEATYPRSNKGRTSKGTATEEVDSPRPTPRTTGKEWNHGANQQPDTQRLCPEGPPLRKSTAHGQPSTQEKKERTRGKTNLP